VITESTSVFKVFRVLWFPVSINAMVLGAAAVLLFWLATWLSCLAIGVPSLATEATKSFPEACRIAVVEGAWPGHATDTLGEGDSARHVHHLLVTDDDEEISDEDRASAEEDNEILNQLFGAWWANEAQSIQADDLSDSERAEAAKSLSLTVRRNLPRYRLVFAWQLVLFFFLWATFGVAICRVMALRMARDEYCTILDAMSYAWRVKLTGCLYPQAVGLPILFLAICNQIAGWVAWVPIVGPIVGVILLPLVIVSSILMILAAVVGIISLGLIPAAIATERKGTYDSLGKAFNYVFARPIPVILHLLVLGTFLQFVHTLFVDENLVERAIASTMTPLWSGSDVEAMLVGEPAGLSGHHWFGAWIFKIILTFFRLLVWGALVSFALGAFTALFLLLRKEVDGMDYIDIARDPAAAPSDPVPALEESPPPFGEADSGTDTEPGAPSDGDNV